MYDNEKKEKVSGMWKGKDVSFSRVWGGYRFTDGEVSDLLADKEIIIKGLTDKNGRVYDVSGKLKKQKYKGNDFVGFKAIKFIYPEEVPDKWCGYEFSDAEKTTLYAGNSVEIKGAIGKSGKSFDCWVSFTKDEDGVRRIQANFDND